MFAYLALAIATEVTGTVALRYSDGFTRLVPTAIVVVGYLVSFFFLSLTLRGLPVSVTYAIWAGTGTAVIALIGVAALGEPLTLLKGASVALIVAGVIGLNLAGSH